MIRTGQDNWSPRTRDQVMRHQQTVPFEKPHTAMGVGSWLVAGICGVIFWTAVVGWWLA
jgi:hypothetical protein